jgi:hypothetical protein
MLPPPFSGGCERERAEGPPLPAASRSRSPRTTALRGLLTAALAFTCAFTARAQNEIRAGEFSRISRAGVPTASDAAGGDAQPTRPQFASVVSVGGGAGAVSNSATLSERYPRGTYLNQSTGQPTGATVVLQRASFGNALAAGVPRYLLGDVIQPPDTQVRGTLAADATYWRAEPIRPGETFSHPQGDPDLAPPVPLGTPRNYYYSPHAERVFASQSGRVTIKWVTRVPIAIGTEGTDAQLRYRYRDETFSVSGSSLKPTRTIYWTERSFSAPPISIPTGSIESVNPVYNTLVPQTVAQEYQVVGQPPNPSPNTAPPPELRTLWFQKTAGIGELRAYNVEGRIMIEYLGALKPGSTSSHVFLGADIVDIVRVAPSTTVTAHLGDRLRPRDSLGRLLPLDGSSELLASPVFNASPDTQSLYGSNTLPDGTVEYYAERENLNPDRIIFYWLQRHDASIRFAVNGQTPPNLGIYWPVQRNHYAQIWPASHLQFHAHYTVGTTGSTAPTGLQFGGGQIPQIIFQDDAAQTETTVDTSTQRLTVSTVGDGLNRTLLKFASGTEVWYVRLYTQSDDRDGFQEGDGLAAINTAATVGQRIEAPSGYLKAGYIAEGTGYNPAVYKNPFAVGATTAETGAIIPVNAVPGNNQLRVWWFQKVTPPSAAFQPFYVPAKVGRYTVSYPANPELIVLASNAGSGDLSPAEIAGRLYVQNDRTQPGFNPNEEHALMIAGRAYALRDDLNNISASATDYTSQPYVLIEYTSPIDARPAMRAFHVVRELDLPGTANDRRFDYTVTAGTMLQGPMPLPILPLPLNANGTVRNTEVPGTPDTAHAAPADLAAHYTRFTFEDRKGYHWVYRGPHANGAPTLGMQFYYTMREGFFIPGVANQPAVGTILPYLRPLNGGVAQGDPVSGTSLTITYRPAWPENAPELRVAETLTLPKFGLPAVLPQASAHILYQQSIARDGESSPSVILHDPIREKVFALGAPGALQSLPTSIRTTVHQGKTYFQALPPHLQNRFYFDPQRGAKGSLVLVGTFTDDPAGDDYLHLNVLSADDRAKLEALPSQADAQSSQWAAAVAGLTTRIETFIPNPAKAGTYISNNAPVSAGPQALAIIQNSDTAVTDYALTATGAGSGWVSLLFGNGRAFTPAGEPVVIQVFKVAPRLYTGELKVLPSSNPLDEQVTLRHSGDFAARPEDYVFDWRYAPPQNGLAPPVYTYALAPRALGTWKLVQNPAATLPTAAHYAAATAVTLPRNVQIVDAAHNAAAGFPGLVARSENGVDFSSGVPGQIVFSADVSPLTGFVLYINGVAALAYQAPAAFAPVEAIASTGLAPGALPREFTLDANYFQRGINRLEVALFSTADVGTASGIDFRLHASSETDQVVAGGSPWQTPNGTLTNTAIVGGSPTAPLGSPLLVMSDNYFTMRYRPKTAAEMAAEVAAGTRTAAASFTNVAAPSGEVWSRWMPPKLVEGWIKRVLAAINPFNQRMTDLYNNAVNTDVSLLTQAGKRWEGDIALTLSNINDFGLIEIYETVLNRGKNISVDSGYDYAPANDALLLAAGYLNDLYTILGNEAFADAANPTISIDDSSSVTEVNTSRFSFEGQVKSVLEEELALLRGRDDFLAPGTTVTPAYNRLYWNYTRGISSGEALYAVNYNIREKSGSSTANGVIDAADAQRMFPQGHGDAYGHYLTALKLYYRLLTNPHFTWTPRSEAVTVLGQAVQVDYFDERKFAGASAALTRTALQVLALTYRERYKDDLAAGWAHFRDGTTNPNTGLTRHWGFDEWAARTTQGAYFNWVVGNALLPDIDDNPQHSGVQIIDRTTVPELAELTLSAETSQTTMDNANARLNPLGLSPGAIAFDISPSELKAGKSHYEQIYERALRSVLNARGAFDQAARMTRLLRNQENQLSSANDAIVDQERAFTKQLIDIYGTPYTGDIGPGKTYAQGYTGPDLLTWFVVDRPTDFVDTTAPLTLSVRVPVNVGPFSTFAIGEVTRGYTTQMAQRTVAIQQSQFVQFSDRWHAGTSAGARSVTGRIQQALLDVHQAHIELQKANTALINEHALFERRRQLYNEMVSAHVDSLARQDAGQAEISRLRLVSAGLNATASALRAVADGLKDTAVALSTYPPESNGLSNDVTSTIRGSIKTTATFKSVAVTVASLVATARARYAEAQAADEQRSMERAVREFGFDYQQAQFVYEYEAQLRDLLDGSLEIAQVATTLQRAHEQLRNVIAEGERVQAEREIFRQRAAGLIQGYRTKDLTFRTFRNEGLEQYRSLFDLAARYTYLAAKSYDYETGLLGSAAGQAVIDGIVASRSLGDLTNNQPQATVSTLGDAGLAGTMARLQADWSVAKGRLGINNPDTNGTLFSLRRELFRIAEDATTNDDDAQWQQTLEQHIVTNLLSDPDVAAAARNLRKPDGSAVPGIVIPFSTTIQHGMNFFGLPSLPGDRNFSPSNFATKIYSAGLVLRGYIGMDPFSPGVVFAGTPNTTAPNALNGTPYVYLIPVGTDYMLAPPLGDTGTVRAFNVRDQALPLPFNLGATQFSSTQFFNANGTLSEQPWILRKHQAFRPVSDPNLFYSSMPSEFTSSRLVGRSVWNAQWKLVIPAYTLMNNEQEGLNRFVASVKDIELFLRTYSHSGN